ncbi:MAG: polyketide cyclase, partial [Verrucomicrobia bacterium RIFCSPLOWO2_12_FULL_64_8]
MTAAKHPAEDTTDREIVSTRVFAAPREKVFAAFSDPAQLMRWWGPAGFSNTFHEFDFRAGGAWRLTMSGPDGVTCEMNKQFVAILPPERIVVRHCQRGHDFVLTMTFTPLGERTGLSWCMLFDDPAEAAGLRPFLLKANNENFDRLAA